MTLDQKVNEFVADHRNWMATAVRECGHHEMYTRRSTGECVICTLESGFVSLDEALELAFPVAAKKATIKISDRMAEALVAAVERDNGECFVRTSTNTTVALMDRGLVSVRLVRVQGQVGHRVHTLTPRGMNVRERLLAQPDGREFLTSVVDAATRKAEPTPVQAVAWEASDKTTRRFREKVPAVTEYSVKIWYKSDTYEGVSHCPEELARKIYADAAASNGVEFAELHGPSGKLVESRGPGLD